jgi:hypothetical protein
MQAGSRGGRRGNIISLDNSIVMVYQTTRLVYEDRPDLETKDVMTIAEAARALGVTVQAVAQSLDRGAMTIVLDTQAPPRQGRRLVLRSEVEALLRERAAFETFEQKWEQAVPAEDTTPLSDEEANTIVHEVRRARRG